MDSDGLPIVGTGIDFTKVGAIHQKRTLAFLNHFVSHTVRFLNRFSCVCEEKLETLTVRLQRLETTMNILDAKLASIPGLEDVTVPTSSSSTTQSSDTSSSTDAAKSDTASPAAAPAAPSGEPTAPQEPAPGAPAEEEKAPQMTVSQDPRYAKFFKMLQVGVPVPALKMKMQAEGLNPDLIENPNAPVPDAGGAQTSGAGGSDAEFSSDENRNSSDDDDDSSGFSD